MIFLTVGTQFPFDRLVQAVDIAVDKGLIGGEIFAQIGDSTYRPRNFESVVSLDKADFDANFRQASHVISHAGIGTITMALEYQKPLLAMPRLKKYGEVVNDHQVDFARKFAQLGHILLANDADELLNTMPKLKSFVPRKRECDYRAVAARVGNFLDELASRQSVPKVLL
jgi:UDP-N-acetylglucosamine transferase subunit ALG13